MSDNLVNTLRRLDNGACDEAADEIERLRKATGGVPAQLVAKALEQYRKATGGLPPALVASLLDTLRYAHHSDLELALGYGLSTPSINALRAATFEVPK